MVSNLKQSVITYTEGVPSTASYVELFCLSTDTKPTANIGNGSYCKELNATTGAIKEYYFNQTAGAWVEVVA